MLILMQPSTQLAFWAANTHCQLMSSLSSISIPPKSLSAGLLSITSSPSLYYYGVLPQPRCRTLHLAWLNLVRFTQAYFSSFSRSLWMVSCPSGVSTTPLRLVSSLNFLRVHLIPLSWSLMKILNSSGPSKDTCRTPLVSDLHLALRHWPLPSGCKHPTNSIPTK